MISDNDSLLNQKMHIIYPIMVKWHCNTFKNHLSFFLEPLVELEK